MSCSQDLDQGKRWVATTFQAMARGRAVEVIWWGHSHESPTIFIAGRLSDERSTRVSHTFPRELLTDCGRSCAGSSRTMVRAEVRRIVERFRTRGTPDLRS